MTQSIDPDIDSSWKKTLSDEFNKEYFSALKETLKKEKSEFTIYPKEKDIFNAFNLTPFNQVKVVIIGQDPYHGPNQAHGLSFSVPDGVKLPPSLRNIYKELSSDLNIHNTTGNLTSWAQQGVLLLNASLTVRENQAGSHAKIGWHFFTDAAIEALSKQRKNLVFILWGNFAKQKEQLIDPEKHLVLKAAHPSPLSAHNGFWNCQHFSKTNHYLEKHSQSPINWQIS